MIQNRAWMTNWLTYGIKKGSDKMLEILMSDFGLTETEAEKFIEEMN